MTALQPGLQRVLMQLVGAGNASLRAQPLPPSLVVRAATHLALQPNSGPTEFQSGAAPCARAFTGAPALACRAVPCPPAGLHVPARAAAVCRRRGVRAAGRRHAQRHGRARDAGAQCGRPARHALAHARCALCLWTFASVRIPWWGRMPTRRPARHAVTHARCGAPPSPPALAAHCVSHECGGRLLLQPIAIELGACGASGRDPSRASARRSRR